MNDRFDHKLEHKLETKPETADDAGVTIRRIEMITGTGRRRQWSSEERTRILMESLVPGANISAVARRHGMSPQQLFGWRREARELFTQGEVAAGPPEDAAPARPVRGAEPTRAAGVPAFAPVVIAVPTQKSQPSAPPPMSPPLASIEITVGDAVVRVNGTVDAAALAVVMKALRRTS